MIPFIKFIDSDISICLEYHDIKNGIVAEHGPKYDVFNRYKNPTKSIKWPMGRQLTLFIADLERLIHPNFDTWTKKIMENLDDFLQEAILIRNKITPTTKEYLRRGGHFGEFEEAVKNYINKGAKIVIFGHTHKSQLQIIGGGIYANCGAWVDDTEPTYIAYYKDRIELKEALTHKVIERLKLKHE